MRYSILYGALAILFFTISCGVTQKAEKKEALTVGYDTASYDYVFIEGIKQKLLGNAGEAIRYFERATEINDRGDASYFQIGQIASQLGDNKTAKKYALRAAELDPENIWYLSFVANLYYMEKNLDSAVIYYEKAVAISPDRESVKYTLASVYSEKGEYDKAQKILDYFDEKYGANESSSLLIIRNMMNSGKYQEAEKRVITLLESAPDELLYNGLLAEIYAAQGEDQKAIDIYKKLIAMDPENPQTLLSLADFFYTKAEYKSFFELLDKLLIKDEVAKEEKINLFVKIFANKEIISKYSNELELSLILLESQYEDDQIIPILRVDYFVNSGQSDRAVDRLNQIIAEKPDNYFACEKLLLIYSEKGDNDNLFKRGGEFAERFNRSFLIKVLYASGATGVGKFDIALAELEKAKILAGNQKEYLVQVYSMEADLYYRQKEYNKAFKIYEDALGLDPENLMILNNYGYFLAEQNQELEKAYKMSKFVIEKESNSTYLDTYAWILYKRGKSKDALKIMTAILKDEAGDAELWEHMGFIQQKLRNCVEATSAWNKALEIDSSKTYLKEEIERCKYGK